MLMLSKDSIYKSTKERNERMRKLCNIVLLLAAVCLLGACGKSASDKQAADVKDSFDTYDGENDNPDTFGEEKREGSGEQVEIGEAVPFSDGLAWFLPKEGENWKCIDVEGNILFEKEGWPDKFTNGYAVVGDSIIIDSEGNDLYDFGSEGYELVDSRALDVGCVILQKDIDTYDKSGTFLYVLDAGEKKITELDFSDCLFVTQDGCEDPIELGDYFGNGYYSLNSVHGSDIITKTYQIIQWYDVKNNTYVNIDTGSGEAEGYWTTYYKTSDPNIFCVTRTEYGLFSDVGQICFINIETCSLETILNGYVSDDYVFPEDGLLLCYNNGDDEYNNESQWFLDINAREKFTWETEYEDYEILSYNGDYFCVSLINDIGTNYLAVVDKEGNTVYDPIEYAYESDFKPCFWGNDFIFYNGEEMCFVNTTSWKIENQVVMDIGDSDGGDDDDDLRKSMCLMDANSPEVKYVVDFDTASYYLPDGSEISAETDNYPTDISSGVFESKLLVWHNDSQSYQFLNNDLTPFQINFK